MTRSDGDAINYVRDAELARMAEFHMHVKTIGRGDGRSVVAAAAYRCGGRLHDERLDRTHDFTNKPGVIHSEILRPANAPASWSERQTLWTAVEAGEKRKDARLAREVEFALPRELSDADNIALARDYVREQFVARGMVADLAVHVSRGGDGGRNPHAHVMLTTRSATPDGFGPKAREWNDSGLVIDWRADLAVRMNHTLAARGHGERVDHRSYRERGIDLEPQTKVGGAAAGIASRGDVGRRAEAHREVAERNGVRIADDPSRALALLTEHRATFTRVDLARLIDRHTDGAEQFRATLARVEASPELVRLGTDARGRERYTSRDMLAVEERLAGHAAGRAARRSHAVAPRRVDRAAADAGLGDEQRRALGHVTRVGGLAFVVGYAGTGKSAMLRPAATAWQESGYRVRGAALSGIAAQGLEGGSGIESRTLASWEWAWSRGREELTARDVLVVDEAGMVGSRQLERVLGRANAAGAKMVLVGDVEQLQAIEAGSAFRTLVARHGAAELTAIHRQRAGWQREATKELATQRTSAALTRYEAAGMVRAATTTAGAREGLLRAWGHDREAAPERSQFVLAHTRADAAALNAGARARMRADGALGRERTVQTEDGPRRIAAGDRVMFRRNDRELGVMNGTLGTLREIADNRLTVQLDGSDGPGRGRVVTFELGYYAKVDHGYAATIHRAQGVTVDRSYLLATPGMDRHSAYVALSRHRDGVEVAYGRDAFADLNALARRLSREGGKDSTLDYGEPAAAATPVPSLMTRLMAALASVPLGRALGADRNENSPGATPAWAPEPSAKSGSAARRAPPSARHATESSSRDRSGAAPGKDRKHGPQHTAGHGAMVEGAKTKMVAAWDADRRDNGARTRVMMAPNQVDAAELNELARGKLREASDMGDDVTVATERGDRAVAKGETVMFLRDDRELNVRDGTTGVVREVSSEAMTVRIKDDDGGRRDVAIDLKRYRALDHGYATTTDEARNRNQEHMIDRTYELGAWSDRGRESQSRTEAKPNRRDDGPETSRDRAAGGKPIVPKRDREALDRGFDR